MMPVTRPRISVDEEFWSSFVEHCKALKVDPSTQLERTLRASMLEFTTAEALDRTSRQISDIHDKIDFLATYLADHFRVQALALHAHSEESESDEM